MVGNASPETITIDATGTYPPWIRNGLVEGVQAAISAKGFITTSTVSYDVYTPGFAKDDGGAETTASCQVAKAPDFIGLSRYSSPSSLDAFITVSISIQTPQNGFCGTIGPASSITGAVAGAFGPVGAGIAAIFGTVSAVCQMSSSS